jgi:hypothetical protein
MSLSGWPVDEELVKFFAMLAHQFRDRTSFRRRRLSARLANGVPLLLPDDVDRNTKQRQPLSLLASASLSITIPRIRATRSRGRFVGNRIVRSSIDHAVYTRPFSNGCWVSDWQTVAVMTIIANANV